MLVEKAYALMEWLSERIAKFPKEHKYTLGNRLSASLYDYFEGCVYLYGEAETRGLRRLSKKLDILRYYVRLSKDLKIISVDQYGHAAEMLNELGRLTGGWMASFRNRKIAAVPDEGPTESATLSPSRDAGEPP